MHPSTSWSHLGHVRGLGVTSQTSDLKELKAQPSQAYAKLVGVSHFTDSCLLNDLALCGIQIEVRQDFLQGAPNGVSQSKTSQLDVAD